MAIRLQYDAAAVVIPPNQSSRKYGQQLVLQQQKYDNEQRQLMQENMYDRQKQFMQNANQLQQQQAQKTQLGQQALANLNAGQVFGAQQASPAQIAQKQKQKQEAEKAEKENIARLEKQQQMDDFDGINSGEFDPKIAAQIKAAWREKNAIPIDKNLDEAMRAENLAEVEERLKSYRESRIQAPSEIEQANKNLKYYIPSMMRYAKPEELEELKKANPNIEVQVFQGDKQLSGSTSKQGPMTPQELPELYGDYYNANRDELKKDIGAVEKQIQDEIDSGTYRFKDGQKELTEDELDAEIGRRLERNYNRMRKNAGIRQLPSQGGQPAAPPQAGQPAAPGAQAPAAPPEMGMQDLEPTYNADGTTAAPQKAKPDAKEQNLIDRGWIKVPKEEMPPGVHTLSRFIDSNGEEVEYVNPKEFPEVLIPYSQRVADKNQKRDKKWEEIRAAEPKDKNTLTRLTPPPYTMTEEDRRYMASLGDLNAPNLGYSVAPFGNQKIEKKYYDELWTSMIEIAETDLERNELVAAKEFADSHPDDGVKNQILGLYNPGNRGIGLTDDYDPGDDNVTLDNAQRYLFTKGIDIRQIIADKIQERSNPVQGQPAATGQPAMPPARPLQPGEEDGGSSFAPRAPGIQQQPVETLPVDQTDMQPPQQNAWAELATPEQQTLEQKPADIAISEKQPVAPVADPDFAKLLESSTDEADKALYGELRSIYDKLVEATGTPQSLEIQNAIGVVVDQKSNPELAAQAYLYLKSQGIDLSKLAKAKKRQRHGMGGIR